MVAALLAGAVAVSGAVVASGAAVAGATAGAGAPSSSRRAVVCDLASMRASFAELPGSPGAGNVVYLLRLVNRTAKTCTLSGRPRLQLLNRAHARLPTHVVAAIAVAAGAKASTVAIRPDGSGWVSARFSPDVPGPGESQKGQCEPTAYFLRVSLTGAAGTVTGAVSPPTPVCEHGQLQSSFLVAKKPTT